jgi:FAD-dependent urate hydroxylase
VQGLRVGVVGAGLGGLAAAIAARRSGQEATVFERTEVFGPVGAGISLWPNGMKVLHQMGLGEEVAARAGCMERMAYSTSAGKPLTDFSLSPLYESAGQRACPIPRATLQELLVAAVGPEHIVFGARCVGVLAELSGPVVVLADGSEHAFDVVVAADGTHSELRTWVMGSPVERRWVGYVNFNAIVAHRADYGPESTWRTWVGEGKRASVMPVGPGAVYAFFDVPYPSEPRAHPGELAEAFAGWDPAVGLLAESVVASGFNRVGIYDVPGLPCWHREGVVLLGDSAHGMAPDLGQGGCQALEDALVLAQWLARGRSVHEALAGYQADRKSRTAEISRRARKRAEIIHGAVPELTRAWYRELAGEDGRRVIAGLLESAVGGPCG